MLGPAPAGGLISALLRSVEALEIARNIHVPDPDAPADRPADTPAARPAGQGRAADRPSALALAAAGGEERAPALAPDRSLAGLRPPSPGAGPATDALPGRETEARPLATAAIPPEPAQGAGAAARDGTGTAASPLEEAPASVHGTDETGPDAGGAGRAARPSAMTAGTVATERAAVAAGIPHGTDDTAPADRGAAIRDPVARGRGSATNDGAGVPLRARAATVRDEAVGATERETRTASPGPAQIRAGAPPTPARDVAAIDGWLPPSGETGGQQVERAGIIASFVLNAAMIPGWPPPRPFAVPEPREQLDGLARLLKLPGDAELLALLERRRARQTLLARLRALLAKPARRLRLLLGLAALEAAVASMLDAIQDELARLARREDEADGDDDPRRLSV